MAIISAQETRRWIRSPGIELGAHHYMGKPFGVMLDLRQAGQCGRTLDRCRPELKSSWP
jgi:hypothetical protein